MQGVLGVRNHNRHKDLILIAQSAFIVPGSVRNLLPSDWSNFNHPLNACNFVLYDIRNCFTARITVFSISFKTSNKIFIPLHHFIHVPFIIREMPSHKTELKIKGLV